MAGRGELSLGLFISFLRLFSPLPKRASVFVFCRLYPFSPQAATGSVWVLPVISLLLTNTHRVGRVLSIFSSRRNWDSPNPSPAGKRPPHFGSGGRGTLAGEKGGGRVPIPTRGHTLWYSIYIYVLCANTVYRGCGLAFPYDGRDFMGPKKKTIVGLLVFNPL
jgi:hypothetical protein